jgi:hypothetical protein
LKKRKTFGRTLVGSIGMAMLVLATLRASPGDSKAYPPVAPELEYFKLRNLMADGMMPNYKAVWYGFRHSDTAATRQALNYMAELTRLIDRYPPPGNKQAPADFRQRMMELQEKTTALSSDLSGTLDRSAISDRILSVYKTCQSCHDTYAPKEREDARKYSPPQ